MNNFIKTGSSIALMAMILGGCTKTNNIQKIPQNNATITNTDSVETSIKRFISNYVEAKNTRATFTEPMPLATAEQNISNAINYEYARALQTLGNCDEMHQNSFTVASSSSTLSASTITTIYNNVIQTLRNVNATYGTTQRQLAIVALKLSFSNGVVTVNVTDMFNKVRGGTPIQFINRTYSFSYTGSGWTWGHQGGFYATPTSTPTNTNIGSSNMLQYAAQYNLQIIGPMQSLHYYINTGHAVGTNWMYGYTPTVVNQYAINVPGILNTPFYANHSNNTTPNPTFSNLHLPDYAMNYYLNNIVAFFSGSYLSNNGYLPAGKTVYGIEVNDIMAFIQTGYSYANDCNYTYGQETRITINTPAPKTL